MCKDECRVCGFYGKEVTDRIEKFKGERTEEIMRLCDLCACVGSICAGTNSAGHKSINELTIIDFINLLWEVIYKIRSNNDPFGDDNKEFSRSLNLQLQVLQRIVEENNEKLIAKYHDGFSNGHKLGLEAGYQKCIRELKIIKKDL